MCVCVCVCLSSSLFLSIYPNLSIYLSLSCANLIKTSSPFCCIKYGHFPRTNAIRYFLSVEKSGLGITINYSMTLTVIAAKFYNSLLLNHI